MRRTLFTLPPLAIGLLIAADDPRSDADRLQGRWVMVSLVIDGEKAPEDQVFAGTLLVEGNHYTPRYEGTTYPETFTLDPGKSPRAIDFTYTDGPRKGETVKGIYKLEADHYVMCRAIRAEDARPRQFATGPGSGLALVVYKRDSPAEAARRKAIEADRKALDGTWIGTTILRDGRKLSDDEESQFRLMIVGDRYTLERGDKIDRGTSQIDPTTRPKSIDLTIIDGEFKGQTWLGIYAIEGDTLKGCFDPGGKDRPRTFASDPGSGQVLRVYRRARP